MTVGKSDELRTIEKEQQRATITSTQSDTNQAHLDSGDCQVRDVIRPQSSPCSRYSLEENRPPDTNTILLPAGPSRAIKVTEPLQPSTRTHFSPAPHYNMQRDPARHLAYIHFGRGSGNAVIPHLICICRATVFAATSGSTTA